MSRNSDLSGGGSESCTAMTEEERNAELNKLNKESAVKGSSFTVATQNFPTLQKDLSQLLPHRKSTYS